MVGYGQAEMADSCNAGMVDAHERGFTSDSSPHSITDLAMVGAGLHPSLKKVFCGHWQALSPFKEYTMHSSLEFTMQPLHWTHV